MRSRRPFTCVAIGLAVVTSACAPKEKTRDVKLRQEWFANANFSGAVLAADEFASDHHVKLHIEEGSESIDPVALVASGNSDFGDAGADRVLAAIGKGAPLVIVGVVNPTSPTVFLALKEKDIHSPKDFEGHRVGLLTGTATEYVYRALLRKTEVDVKKIKEVEAGFDLQGFLAGTYDVRPAFAYDEPVSLDAKKVAYTVVNPKEYGIHFIGTVYFTRQELVQKDHTLVRDTVYSLADGWRLAVHDPKRAIASLKKHYPSISEDRELRSLEEAIKYVIPPSGKILLASHDDWEGTLDALRNIGLLRKFTSLDPYIDESFVYSYYNHEVGETTNRK